MVDAFGEASPSPCADEWVVTGGSSTVLAAQVQEGSRADLFVAAGTEALGQLSRAGLTVGEPVALGSVRATLFVGAVRTGPVALRDLPGLADDGWKIGVCVAPAPCGAMADRVFANAAAVWGDGFTRGDLVATEAESAAALVSKVGMGEIDAALIYEHVCVPPPGASMVGRCEDIPDSVGGRPVNVRTPYSAVRLRAGAAADSFMEYVSSVAFREFIAQRLRIG